MRDHYIRCLEKLSAESALSPNYQIDNAAAARKEHTSNMGDVRSSLKGLFANAGEVEQNNTKTMDSLLPSKSGMDRETGNPLMKVAFQKFFPRDGFLYGAAISIGFSDELQKIAGARPTFSAVINI